MNSQERKQIRKELGEISPWPWKWECICDFHKECIGKGLDAQCDNIRAGRIHLINETKEIILCDWAEHAWDAGIEVKKQDAQFIASAPSRIAALLVEVERLEMELDKK